jgi:hypothetical protein
MLPSCDRVRTLEQDRRVQGDARERGRPGGVPARALRSARPRGNLELARAAADVCSTAELHRWARLGPDEAPTGTAEEFLALAGVLGLGGPLVKGDGRALEELRRHASDPRWRIREAVAMALQRWGEADFEALGTAMHEWAHGTWLERRAAAAALCEPALLTTPERVGEALAVLAEATAGIAEAGAEERRSEEFRALRKKGSATAGAWQWSRRRRSGGPRSKSSCRGRGRATTPIWRGLLGRTCASGGWSASTLGGFRGCSSASDPLPRTPHESLPLPASANSESTSDRGSYAGGVA